MSAQQTSHPTADRLLAFRTGRLDAAESAEIERHLANCESCRLKVASPRQTIDAPAASSSSTFTSDPPASGPVAVTAPEGGVAVRGAAHTAKEAAGPSSQRRTPMDLPPQFGRYQIVKRLGHGGMGSVYLAVDTYLDRRVAIKVPHMGAAENPRILERFYREAKAAATLTHPNLCSVYEVGQIEGIHYQAMAYLEGRLLSDFISSGKKFAERHVAAVVRKLALALEEAHAHGVIHRDLKPTNIMITGQKEPVIMDFGLARLSKKEDPRITKVGAILGTPSYMSPEQVMGDVEAMGPPCDIYALGVILYEMLAGRLPFEGPITQVLAQVMLAEPPRPSEFRSDLDRWLEAICLKAMAKKAQDRYASMAEFAGTLGDYLRGINPPENATPRASSSKVKIEVAEASGEQLAAQFFEEAGAASEPTGDVPPMTSPENRRTRQVPRWAWILAGGLLVLLGLSVLIVKIETGARVDPNAIGQNGIDGTGRLPPIGEDLIKGKPGIDAASTPLNDLATKQRERRQLANEGAEHAQKVDDDAHKRAREADAAVKSAINFLTRSLQGHNILKAPTMMGCTITGLTLKGKPVEERRFQGKWFDHDQGIRTQYFGATSPGDVLEGDIEVPGNENYNVEVFLSGGPDYGVVTVSLDGKPLIGAADTYQPEFAPCSKRFKGGPIRLNGGANRLRIAAIHKNKAASAAHIGFVSLWLSPDPGSPMMEKWSTIGPWPCRDQLTWKVKNSPEERQQLDRVHAGPDGKNRIWQHVEAKGGIVCFPFVSWTAYYGLTYVWSPDYRSVGCFIGKDDALKIWVNDEPCFDLWSWSHLIPDSFHCQVRLKRGWNKMLVKNGNFDGAFGFSIRLGDPDRVLKYAHQPQAEAVERRELEVVRLEGEDLSVRKSSNFAVGRQEMGGFGDGVWSGNAQLLGQPRKRGEWVDLEIPVARAGKYRLFVHMTKSWDYGILQFRLNDKIIGLFDGFNQGKVIRTDRRPLGIAHLEKGTSRLRIVVVGTNPKSGGARYFWGLDCLILDPVLGEKNRKP
jgi:serine/threonine protein kinase